MSSRLHSCIVNALTFSRVPLIFAFLVCAVLAQRRACVGLAVAAGVLMFCAAISDLYDGRLARKWKVVSTFGKLADPLMDKVFFIVSFPTLLWVIGAQGESPTHALVMLVFTVLYILRDQWVTFPGSRLHLRLPGAAPPAAARVPGAADGVRLRGRGRPHRPQRLLLCGVHAGLLALPGAGHRRKVTERCTCLRPPEWI